MNQKRSARTTGQFCACSGISTKTVCPEVGLDGEDVERPRAHCGFPSLHELASTEVRDARDEDAHAESSGCHRHESQRAKSLRGALDASK